MATLTANPNKNGTTSWTIQFFFGKKRRYLGLPSKYDRNDAEMIRDLIGELIESIELDRPISRRSKAILDTLPKELKSKFSASGLLEGNENIDCVELWERLFHNLRGSRLNELFSEYPSHIASEWMGQSTKIVESHYFHATEEFFEKATDESCKIEKKVLQ